jgi:hypothetical protein
MARDDIEALIGSLEEAGEAFARLIEGLSPAEFGYRASADDWSPAELAGHVSEFPETFSLQAVHLAQHPGADVHRSQDDPGRLAAIARLQGAGPAEAAALVRQTIADACARLRTIAPGGWESTGRRVVNGEVVTTRQLVEYIVLGHVRMHLAQARETIAAARSQPS